jgi:hypothetical protein
MKPPLGLVPKKFHQMERLVAIQEAMERYYEAVIPIPQEWVTEYNELVNNLRDES